jgi:hypothetical protein
MSFLLCVFITWATISLFFMGLGLIFLLRVERGFGRSEVPIEDEPAAGQMLGMPRPNAPILQHESAQERCQSTASDRKPSRGAVVIRDPRLTNVRALRDYHRLDEAHLPAPRTPFPMAESSDRQKCSTVGVRRVTSAKEGSGQYPEHQSNHSEQSGAATLFASSHGRAP